jgi:hypothetical protein
MDHSEFIDAVRTLCERLRMHGIGGSRTEALERVEAMLAEFDAGDEDEYGDRPIPPNAVVIAETVLSEREET